MTSVVAAKSIPARRPIISISSVPGAGNLQISAGSVLQISRSQRLHRSSGNRLTRTTPGSWSSRIVCLFRPHWKLPPTICSFNGNNLVVTALEVLRRQRSRRMLAHFKKYRSIVSPFLSAAITSFAKLEKGESGRKYTAWYLLPPPSGGMAVIQVGYRRPGRPDHRCRGETNFNTLGLAMRMYWDYGIQLHDYRTGQSVSRARDNSNPFLNPFKSRFNTSQYERRFPMAILGSFASYVSLFSGQTQERN